MYKIAFLNSQLKLMYLDAFCKKMQMLEKRCRAHSRLLNAIKIN